MARVALEVDSSRSEYPLSDLPWAQDFDTNIASYEHPILALSFMPAFSDWAEVKEAEFFCEPSDRADWQIFIESESGSYSAAPVINELDPAIYLLITKPLRRSQGQTEVELGDSYTATGHLRGPRIEAQNKRLPKYHSRRSFKDFEHPNLMSGGTLIQIRLPLQ